MCIHLTVILRRRQSSQASPMGMHLNTRSPVSGKVMLNSVAK